MVTYDFPIDIVRVLFPTFLVHSFTSSLRQVIISPPLIIFLFFLEGREISISVQASWIYSQWILLLVLWESYEVSDLKLRSVSYQLYYFSES